MVIYMFTDTCRICYSTWSFLVVSMKLTYTLTHTFLGPRLKRIVQKSSEPTAIDCFVFLVSSNFKEETKMPGPLYLHIRLTTFKINILYFSLYL